MTLVRTLAEAWNDLVAGALWRRSAHAVYLAFANMTGLRRSELASATPRNVRGGLELTHVKQIRVPSVEVPEVLELECRQRD
ncbi:hypothetical protein BKK81_33955 (plasmid) [Cupriavidus sp. USMAHM13]|nr:hypothetical protein BKK81_33955 [Cupriavidus sp. USMAHM13]